MKYLLLALLLTTGCATTHSEYYNGCHDVLDLIVTGPPKNKDSLCSALESRRFKHAEEVRERAGGRYIR